MCKGDMGAIGARVPSWRSAWPPEIRTVELGRINRRRLMEAPAVRVAWRRFESPQQAGVHKRTVAPMTGGKRRAENSRDSDDNIGLEPRSRRFHRSYPGLGSLPVADRFERLRRCLAWYGAVGAVGGRESGDGAAGRFSGMTVSTPAFRQVLAAAMGRGGGRRGETNLQTPGGSLPAMSARWLNRLPSATKVPSPTA